MSREWKPLGSNTKYDRSQLKARKQHTCIVCSLPILPGTHYWEQRRMQYIVSFRRRMRKPGIVIDQMDRTYEQKRVTFRHHLTCPEPEHVNP